MYNRVIVCIVLRLIQSKNSVTFILGQTRTNTFSQREHFTNKMLEESQFTLSIKGYLGFSWIIWENGKMLTILATFYFYEMPMNIRDITNKTFNVQILFLEQITAFLESNDYFLHVMGKKWQRPTSNAMCHEKTWLYQGNYHHYHSYMKADGVEGGWLWGKWTGFHDARKMVDIFKQSGLLVTGHIGSPKTFKM